MGMIRHSYYQVRRQAGEGEGTGTARIAVLADLHNNVYRSDVPTLLEEIRAEHCDAVLSAGDLVVMKGGHFAMDQAILLACSLARTMPVYVANGNHETRMERLHAPEYARYERALKKGGVISLHNRSEDVTLNGVRLRVTGLELDRRYFRSKYHKDLSVKEMKALIGSAAGDRLQVLLAHHPKFFPVYARWGADLVLSGHLHGGIVRLPWLGGVVSPDPGLFPKYDHGLYEMEDARMVVSAGLGTHSINLRINNPAELVIVEITLDRGIR
ncbi:MAG TPA: serine/threonine protein phosphatase [Lachnospiraceae bacterium]|nr:serine/threonine protein phosphatase [Lachnospiraceae bacterium]